MKRKPLTALRTILQTAARSLGVERAAHEAMIQEMWAEVVGPDAAAHARPAGLRGTTLLVDAEAGLWVQELSAQRGGIVEAINQRLGVRAVEDIRIRSGRMSVERSTDQAVSAADRRADVTPDDLAHVERTVAEIADPELREATRRAMISQLRWRRGGPAGS